MHPPSTAGTIGLTGTTTSSAYNNGVPRLMRRMCRRKEAADRIHTLDPGRQLVRLVRPQQVGVVPIPSFQSWWAKWRHSSSCGLSNTPIESNVNGCSSWRQGNGAQPVGSVQQALAVRSVMVQC